MGVTDTVMAGRLSATDLAAVALGSSLWLPIYLACVGLLMALSPTVAQLMGARRLAYIGPVFRQALWLALAIAVAATTLTRHVALAMPWLNIDPAITPIADEYLDAIAWGMPAVCLYLALRFVSEGVGHTKPIMYIQLVALIVNAAGNYALMYGQWGAPALGAVGAGWSSAIVLCIDAVLMLAYVATHSRYYPLNLFTRIDRPVAREIGQLLKLGTPIAATITMEVGLFTAVALLMGSLGVVVVAAHQIAINYAGLMFMIPLGISMAITIRVGHAAGAGDLIQVRVVGVLGMGMSVLVMAISAMIILIIPDKIVAIYTSEPAVAELAMQLLFMAALFQLSDGLQVSAVGALRGLKDTAHPMLITFLAYWVVGLPLAWLLGIDRALGPQGLWVGLILGLTVAAILLSIRFHVLTRKLIGHRTQWVSGHQGSCAGQSDTPRHV